MFIPQTHLKYIIVILFFFNIRLCFGKHVLSSVNGVDDSHNFVFFVESKHIRVMSLNYVFFRIRIYQDLGFSGSKIIRDLSVLDLSNPALKTQPVDGSFFSTTHPWTCIFLKKEQIMGS
jgi:hypothetical protein